MAHAVSPQQRTQAILLLVAAGLFWSTAGVLIKYVTWHPLAIWAVRCGVSGAVLAAVIQPAWGRVTSAEWGAALTHAATTGMFIAANKLTTPANAILIQYSAPVWVALLGAWMLGEKATRGDWMTIVAVLGGVAVFFFEQLTLQGTAGNLIALAAGIGFAFHIMLLRKVASAGGQPLRAVIIGNAIGALAGAYWCFATPGPSATGWAALIALGVVQQAGAYFCYGWAIRRVTALTGLLIPIIEPILSPVWVLLVFGEQPGRWALVGGVVVVGAVTMRALRSLRANKA